tara:strand:- start:3190 stop:3765 length:576 start_codon:yes stop_codon:yes gene_type:complete
MANQDAAFGLKPIGYLGSAPMNSGLTEFEVAACASAMFQNDLIQAINTGTVGIAAASDNGQLLGSLQGVFFTDASTSKPTFANNLKASNTATDIKAFVSDNPHQLYEIQSDNAGASGQTDVFNNADVAVGAGVTPNFISKTELGDSTQATTTANLRIIGVSDDAKNNDLTSANVNWKVIIIEHLYLTATGV